MLQPDLGTGTVMVGASMIIIFTAGARMKHLSLLALGGVAGFAALIAAAPYRLQRITAFLGPVVRSAGCRISDYSIVICDWSWGTWRAWDWV